MVASRLRLLSLLSAALSVTAIRGSSAAPPDFAVAPADASWLVHIDLDAWRQSTAAQQICKQAARKWKSLPAQLEKLNRQSGMDLAKDLHSLTIFGVQPSPQHAVLVMRADWDQDTFRRKMALTPSHSIFENTPYEIHACTQDNHGQARHLLGALWKRGTFVFGGNAEDVKLSLDVLDGKARNLSGESSMLAAPVPPGTILTARLMCGGNPLPVESPMLKQTEQIDFTCGESAGEWRISARLRVKSREAARDAKRLADGLLAVLRLQQAEDADLSKLIDRLQIHVDERTLGLDFRAPAADVGRQVAKTIEHWNPVQKPAQGGGN
jgi:hypothetical protein